MLLLPLIIHLLDSISKDAHLVEYEERGGVELQLLEVNMLVVCVCV